MRIPRTSDYVKSLAVKWLTTWSMGFCFSTSCPICLSAKWTLYIRLVWIIWQDLPSLWQRLSPPAKLLFTLRDAPHAHVSGRACLLWFPLKQTLEGVVCVCLSVWQWWGIVVCPPHGCNIVSLTITSDVSCEGWEAWPWEEPFQCVLFI